MKTKVEIADQIVIRYNDDQFPGGELDMVRAAVIQALTEDRASMVHAIEELKEPMPVDDYKSGIAVNGLNAGLYLAQDLLRKAD